MKEIKVAINGVGRIGRAFLKLAIKRKEIKFVAINDLGDIDNITYLLKHDTVYGNSDLDVDIKDGNLVINKHEIKFLSEKDPSKLPWNELDIDIVVEATGVFTKYESAKMHLDAGAKRVVISAPGKGDETLGETILLGVNEDKFATCDISSNGSCTTNAASPIVSIIDETLDIEKAVLNTIHSYTASQSLVDGPNKKDMRLGRSAAQNIIPSSTGAATSVTKAVTGVPFFDGISVRVPSVIGSYVDLTFVTKKETTKEEVNAILSKAEKEDRWKGIFRTSNEPLVSSDIRGDLYASVADLQMTRVVGGNLVKIMSWYDNEIGYSNTLVEHVIRLGQHIK